MKNCFYFRFTIGRRFDGFMCFGKKGLMFDKLICCQIYLI